MLTDKTTAAAPPPPLPPALEWASYACIAPLLAGLACVGLLPDFAARELAQRGSLGWGGVLLGMSGAVHLGLMCAGRLPARGTAVTAALAPSLCGAAAIVVGGQRGLALLTVGFGLFWLYEHRLLGTQLPPAYVDLRRHLSVATCVLLAVTMFISDANGLA
ncbi:MAG: DUF3429 family protein [Proteobacteria bacterium]|nr:DUF3429 family protein [Pseudomonadota bacterium]